MVQGWGAFEEVVGVTLQVEYEPGDDWEQLGSISTIVLCYT